MESLVVSIIMPAYNSEKYIADSIQSIQKQTYANWQLLIVDDCSTDNTVSVVNKFIQLDSRIQLFQLRKNEGTGVARNTALSKASGRYIAFLDADDLWKPLKLESQIAFMQSNKLPFTFSFYDCINVKGETLSKTIYSPKKLTYLQLFFCNYIGNLTAIYDVNYFGKLPISNIRKRQDWMLWLTILKEIKNTKPVPESLAFYRIRKNAISSAKINLLKYNFGVYRNFHKLNILMATLCMIGFLFTQLIIKPFYIKKH